jgi:hypothetical protein
LVWVAVSPFSVKIVIKEGSIDDLLGSAEVEVEAPGYHEQTLGFLRFHIEAASSQAVIISEKIWLGMETKMITKTSLVMYQIIQTKRRAMTTTTMQSFDCHIQVCHH